MTLVLSETEPPERGRWLLSLCAVLALHAGAAAVLATWRITPPPSEAAEAVMLDLPPALAPPAPEPAPAPEPVAEPVPEPPPPEPPLPEPPPPEPPPPEPPPPEPPPPEPLPLPDVPLLAPPEPPPPVAEVAVPLPPPPPLPVRPKPVERRPPPPAAEPPPRRAPPPAAAPPTAAAAPAPAPTVAPASPPASAVASWRGALLRHLERYKRYPRAAQLQRMEGMAHVRVTLDRQGVVLGARLESSAGYSILDSETVEMVRRASPLPAPPPEFTSDHIELVVPVEFALR